MHETNSWGCWSPKLLVHVSRMRWTGRSLHITPWLRAVWLVVLVFCLVGRGVWVNFPCARVSVISRRTYCGMKSVRVFFLLAMFRIRSESIHHTIESALLAIKTGIHLGFWLDRVMFQRVSPSSEAPYSQIRILSKCESFPEDVCNRAALEKIFAIQYKVYWSVAGHETYDLVFPSPGPHLQANYWIRILKCLLEVLP